MRSAFNVPFVSCLLLLTDACAAPGDFPCDRKLVCTVPITVNTSVTPCTATAPYRIVINRNTLQARVVIRLKIDPPSSTATFVQTDPVKFDSFGSKGTPWGDHFEPIVRFSDRILWIIDKNPNDEEFKYDFYVENGPNKCKSVDPFILNTN